MMIAVSVIDILNPFWSAFCKKVERLALEKGYIAVFMNANPDSSREKQEIGMMIQHGVDGLMRIRSLKRYGRCGFALIEEESKE